MVQHLSEKETRQELIDKKLKLAWWNVHDRRHVVPELPLEREWATTLYVDYALYATDGTVLAIVEAKKFSRDVRAWKHQALEYAEIIAESQWHRPMIFLTNGKEIAFYNSALWEVPRTVRWFYSVSDLHRRKFLNENRTSAWQTPIDPDISGRWYQMEAIKKVAEWVDEWRRSFLLVMATGTGKTRTAMGLIDVLLSSSNAQKVLFLCDRESLREQAHDDGFTHIPHEPKTQIITWSTDKNARLYAATYQTMINKLDEYTSGYFDLVIVDEVHRSLYGDWHAILEHFDAIKVWLTATPVQHIDRNTYKVFGLRTEDPTYFYGLDDAIAEWYLTPYQVLIARTTFQIQWIKGRQLPDEVLEQLEREGKTIEEVNFEGTDLEKKISNIDTNRVMIKEFMQEAIKAEDGLPGKTIIFAQTQKHADTIQKIFEEMYPSLDNFSVVITSNVEKSSDLIKQFKKYKKEKKYRIAISVAMLDTGIDVPEVVNLVFAKKVFSEPKFWQMIGRWTRLCPDLFGPWLDKQHFLIFDYGLNFDDEHVFKSPSQQVKPLQQQYFESLMDEMKLWEYRQNDEKTSELRERLTAMVASLDQENIEVMDHRELINDLTQWKIWNNIAVNPYEQLQKIAPLMRYYAEDTLAEMKFLTKGSRLKQAILTQDESQEKLMWSLASDIHALPTNISAVEEKTQVMQEVLTQEFWVEIDTDAVDELMDEFVSLMRYRKPQARELLITDLKDEVIERRWVTYDENKKMETDKYWKVFESQMEDMLSDHPTIQKVIRDEPVSSSDLAALEMVLKQHMYRIDLTNLRIVMNRPTVSFEQLMRFALGKGELPSREEEVHRVFETHMQEHNYDSHQIRFLQIIKSKILLKQEVSYEALYSPAIEGVLWAGAVDRLFGGAELEKIMGLVEMFSFSK